MKCPSCQTENQNSSKFCIHCGESLTVTSSPSEGIRRSPSAATNKRYAQDKDPTLAAILDIIPGLPLGQFYNGDVIKGIMILAGAIFLGWTGIVLLAIWVWSIIDAYQVAKGNKSLWK